MFDDQRNGPALQAGNAGKIGARKSLASPDEVDDNVSGNLASRLVRRTLPADVDHPGNIEHPRRLTEGWEYLQGSLGGPWEAWHSEEVAVWQPVTMPHCFNAYDGCDPDVPYYRGNGWYRTHVPIANPFA